MITAVNLNTDLDSLVLLEGRGEHTTEAEAQASFTTVSKFRDGGIFVAHFSGSSGWEIHPKGDELVQILEGATRLDIIVDDEIQSLDLTAGSVLVVPQNSWHRFDSKTGVKVMTATPQPTQHSHVDDPRSLPA
jgi:mannose-6-phosphate isomerase-like protein (cupin superfamily)